MLAALLERGVRYAMIANADNLGATPDPAIARLVAAEQIPFLMEVVEGTEADRKGGHIARRRSDGQLVLRETAQTPPQDEESFRDYRRWRYYNTNNLWIDLRVLAETLDRTRRRARAAADRQPQDGRPARPQLAGRSSSSRARWARRSRASRERGSCACRGPASSRSRRPTTCCVLRSDAYALGAHMAVEPVAGAGRSAPARRARPPLLQAARRLRAALPGWAAVAARRAAADRAAAT